MLPYTRGDLPSLISSGSSSPSLYSLTPSSLILPTAQFEGGAGGYLKPLIHQEIWPPRPPVLPEISSNWYWDLPAFKK